MEKMIFVSYAHTDFELIKPYINEMKRRNYRFWMDTSIQEGDEWREKIEKAIKSSSVTFAFISNNYLQRPFCKSEREKSDENGNLFIQINLLPSIRGEYATVGKDNYQMCGYSSDPKIIFDKIENNRPLLFKDECLKKSEEIDDSDLVFVSSLKQFIHEVTDYQTSLLSFKALLLAMKKSGYQSYSFDDISVYKNKDNPVIMRVSQEGKDSLDVFIEKALSLFFNDGGKENDCFDRENISSYFNDEFINGLLFEFLNDRTIDEYQTYMSDLCDCYTYIKEKNRKKHVGINPFIIQYLSRESIKKYLNDSQFEYFPNLLKKDEKIRGVIKNPLIEVFEKEHNFYLQGNPNSGKTGLLINAIDKGKIPAIYINLNEPNYRQLLLDGIFFSNNIERGGMNFTEEDFVNYSCTGYFYIVVDGIDRLDDTEKVEVIKELRQLSYFNKVVIASRNKDLVSRIRFDSKDEFDNFDYYEILPFDEEIISCFFQRSSNPNIRTLKDKDLDSVLTDHYRLDYFVKTLNSITDKKEFDQKILEIRDLSDLLRAFFVDDTDTSIKTKCKKMLMDHLKSFYLNGFTSLIDKVFIDCSEYALSLVYEDYEISNENFDQNSFSYLSSFGITGIKDGKHYFIKGEHRDFFAAYFLKYQLDLLLNEPLIDEDSLILYFAALSKHKSVARFLGELIDEGPEYLEPLFESISLSEHKPLLDETALSLYLVITFMANKCDYSVDFHNTIKNIPESFFDNIPSVKSIIVPNGVTEISRTAFLNMKDLREITFGDDVFLIHPWAIINCSNLQKITFGKSYRDYHAPMIEACENIEDIEVSPKNSSFSSDFHEGLLSKDEKTLYFAATGIKSISLKDKTEEIKSWAIKGCSRLAELNITENVKEIETDFSDECLNLTKMTVDEKNKVFKSIDGIFLTYQENDRLILHRVCPGVTGELRIPAGINEIGDDAVSTCRKITSLYIPKTVTSLGSVSLADLTSLETLYFEDLFSLKECGSFVLLNHCPSLQVFALEDGGYVEKSLNRDILPLFKKMRKKSGLLKNTFVREGLNTRDFILAVSDCELLYQNRKEEKYSCFSFMRMIDLFENERSFEKSFNILLFGLVEYNYLLSLDYERLSQTIIDWIDRYHLDLIVITRDLPCPKEILESSVNRCSIVRTPISSTRIFSEETVLKLGGK